MTTEQEVEGSLVWCLTTQAAVVAPEAPAFHAPADTAEMSHAL